MTQETKTLSERLREVERALTIALEHVAGCCNCLACTEEGDAADNALSQLPDIIRSIEALVGQGWQTMETAPRDGTWLLLYGVAHAHHGFPACYIGGWPLHADWVDEEPQDGWMGLGWDQLGELYEVEATHWMPLPKPPESEAP